MFSRVTSRMMMTNYKTTLGQSMSKASASSTAVYNERKYQKDSDDTVSSTRAYQYRREMIQAENAKANTQAASSVLASRDSVMLEMESVIDQVHTETIAAKTDTMNEDNRKAYAQNLRNLQSTLVQLMNTSVDGSYLFGGNNTETAPLSVGSDGTVNYRGIPMDGLVKQSKLAVYDDLEGEGLTKNNPEAMEEYINNLAQLDQFNNEKQYVDIGCGLNSIADGTINDQNAFNLSCSAISFLGTGRDSNGNSQNLLQLIGDLADAFDSDEMEYDGEYVDQLMANYEDAMTNFNLQLTQIGSDENYLTTNETRLETYISSLTEKTNDAEYIDQAEAITNWQADQYSYQAALQIGNKMLSMSFLDYMS